MPWWKSRGARGGLLVLLACAIAWMRWHTYAEPRERDPDGEDRLLALRMLVWMAGIFLAVALPGQALVRYFQLWLPWLCVAVALTIARAAAIARAQRRRERPADVFGVFPGLYSAAGREPPSGVLNLWLALPAYGAGLSPALSRRVLDELQGQPPDMIVLDGWTWQLAGAGNPIREWIKAHYEIVSDRYDYSLAIPAAAKPAEKP